MSKTQDVPMAGGFPVVHRRSVEGVMSTENFKATKTPTRTAETATMMDAKLQTAETFGRTSTIMDSIDITL